MSSKDLSKAIKAYLLKDLGYKGLGNTDTATEILRKAVELSAGNLCAQVEIME